MSHKRRAWFALALVFVGLLAATTLMMQAEAAGPPINCRFVLCAYPDCGPGYKTVIPPGQCCPVCVPA